jgi:hypothetical protein
VEINKRGGGGILMKFILVFHREGEGGVYFLEWMNQNLSQFYLKAQNKFSKSKDDT